MLLFADASAMRGRLLDLKACVDPEISYIMAGVGDRRKFQFAFQSNHEPEARAVPAF